MKLSCTGGWCPKRGQCADYHRRTAEDDIRLCPKGEEEPTPMRDVRFDAWLAGATEEQVKRWQEKVKP